MMDQRSAPKYRKQHGEEHGQLEMKVPRQNARPHWYFEHPHGFGGPASISRFDPAYHCVLHDQLPLNLLFFAGCKLARREATECDVAHIRLKFLASARRTEPDLAAGRTATAPIRRFPIGQPGCGAQNAARARSIFVITGARRQKTSRLPQMLPARVRKGSAKNPCAGFLLEIPADTLKELARPRGVEPLTPRSVG